jgi:NlpC/P60 family
MAADMEFWGRQDSPLFPVSRSGRVRPCPRCQRRHREMLLILGIILGLVAGILTALAARPAPAYDSTTGAVLTSYVSPGNRILDKAETRLNDGYAWGGTGPSLFDCSGLVYWAAGAAGERGWPRDTLDIAREIGSRFSITSRPQRGDLAMWGSYGAPYHVEMVTIWPHENFGAETYGWSGRVTWHDDTWFRPSFYLRINW